jgi:dipeptidyl aminopeptidase/acylaminoacyl peptidase
MPNQFATAACSCFLAASPWLPIAAQVAEGASAPPSETRGNLVLDGIPALNENLSARLENYLQSRQASFVDWLPDGSLLIATRFADTEQLHRVAAPLGAREQLTWYGEPVNSARVPQVANAAGFAFLKDRGGDENSQVYFYRFADRSARLLTDGKSLHGDLQWSPDGKRVAYYGNDRDGVSYDIYVAEPASAALPRLVVNGNRATWYPLGWSPDGTRLLLLHYVSISEAYLYAADVASGALTAIDAGNGKERIGIDAAKFAPDGRGVYLVSDKGSEFRQLRYYDLSSARSRVLTERIPWDITAFDVAADGRYVAWVANVDGLSRLTVEDTAQQSDLVLPAMPAGVITTPRFDRGGRRLAFSLESALSPRDVFVLDLERSALVRWTQSEAGPVDASRFVAAELLRFPSWDRVNGKPRQIPAFVYRPATPGPHPVLINIHGGPESQYRPTFDAWTQFLVNELGFVVVAPNVRGSSGYGRTYLALDDAILRQDAVRDVGALLVWLGLQADVDRARIFVAGGSYGGFMSLASLVAYGDRLRGGIDVVGISNFATFLENTSAYRRDLRRAEYGDERDSRMRAYFAEISPLNNAAAIRSPLFVVQGLNDPRVPAAQSEQLVAIVRAHGGEVWYLAAKDEGHGLRKKSNRDFYLKTAATFLDRLSK